MSFHHRETESVVKRLSEGQEAGVSKIANFRFSNLQLEQLSIGSTGLLIVIQLPVIVSHPNIIISCLVHRLLSQLHPVNTVKLAAKDAFGSLIAYQSWILSTSYCFSRACSRRIQIKPPDRLSIGPVLIIPLRNRLNSIPESLSIYVYIYNIDCKCKTLEIECYLD